MYYAKETYELYNSLREKHIVSEIVEISKHLICLSLSCEMFRDGYDKQQKDEIYKSLNNSIPETIEVYLEFYRNLSYV